MVVACVPFPPNDIRVQSQGHEEEEKEGERLKFFPLRGSGSQASEHDEGG